MSVLGDTPTDNVWIDSQMGILTLERDKIGAAVAKEITAHQRSDLSFKQRMRFAKPLGWLRGELEEQQTKS